MMVELEINIWPKPANFERIDVHIVCKLIGHEKNNSNPIYNCKYAAKEHDEVHQEIINTHNI